MSGSRRGAAGAGRVTERFGLPGEIRSIDRFGRGNINDTYLVVCGAGGGERRFVLQRINGRVFPRPELTAWNMRRVLEHLALRAGAGGGPERMRQWRFPRLVPARDGGDCVTDEAGDCWRIMTCVAGARTYAKTRNAGHAFEVGLALGEFHRRLNDMDPAVLFDPLPGFHVTPRYVEVLDAAVAAGGSRRPAARVEARALLDFVDRRRDWCGALEAAKRRGELRVRVVHGDPKVDNVLIDERTGGTVGLIDFDTTRPGLLPHDFGDCLRSACNPAGEDPGSADRVRFDPGLCRETARGYFLAAGEILTAADRSHLYEGVRLMTFELAVRFLADFLAGNVYFRVRDPERNLRRALVQKRLCESIEAQEAQIRKTVGDT